MTAPLTASTPRVRDSLFDNYKAFLILMVVIGHFIEPCYKNNVLLYDLKWLIVSFHMPAFIFVSGFLSKRKSSFKKLLHSLVIPYFVYELLYYCLYTWVIHKPTGLYLTRPKFTLWYLAGLFVWKILSPVVRRIPFYFPLSVLAGLLIGLSSLGNYLSIPRIVFFFPFFLAGQCFERKHLERIPRRIRMYGLPAAVSFFILFLTVKPDGSKLTPYIFYGRYSYEDLHMSAPEGIAVRCVCYLISFVFVFLILAAIPDRRLRCTEIGRRTMPVYIFHGMILASLNEKTDLLSNITGYPESLFLLAFCAFLVFLLSRKPFLAVTDQISNLHRLLPDKIRIPELHRIHKVGSRHRTAA